ncbi:hypothetical protein CHS0354_026412 [Potamilus streckersoni]|uniref:Uncharacterized protein n=1 Tax=Potamilus streckersoni TaxID=2493646 RepID=A0AAE0W735_9BIVA|nr:hypothetical protein CHS0354_026412 [Potamilus streckersoni]
MYGTEDYNHMYGTEEYTHMYETEEYNHMYGTEEYNHMYETEEYNHMYETEEYNHMYETEEYNHMYGTEEHNHMYGTDDYNHMYETEEYNHMYGTEEYNHMYETEEYNHMYGTEEYNHILSPEISIIRTDSQLQLENLYNSQRPSKLAERFLDLYFGEYTHAFKELTTRGMQERDIVFYLLQIVTVAYEHCRTAVELNLNEKPNSREEAWRIIITDVLYHQSLIQMSRQSSVHSFSPYYHSLIKIGRQSDCT